MLNILTFLVIFCFVIEHAKAETPDLYRSWEFTTTNAEIPSRIVKLPFIWNSQKELAEVEVGVFRKRIDQADLLGQDLGLLINERYASNMIPYAVYINEALIHEYGFEAKEPPSQQMIYPRNVIKIPAQDRPFLLTIKVFKSQQPWPGIAKLQLKSYPQLSLSQNIQNKIALFLLGILFMVAIYHALHWLWQRREKDNLYVALMATIVCLFSALHNAAIFSPFLELNVRQFWLIQGFCWFAIFSIVDLFSYSIFPTRFPKRKAPVTILVSILTWIGCWYSPNFLLLFQVYSWLSIFQLSYFCWGLRKDATLRSYLFTLEISFIILGSVGDLLIGLGKLDSPSLVPYFMMGLVFVEVYYISHKNNETRNSLALEKKTVENLNTHLEMMVEEQTREIKSILQSIQIGIVLIKKPGLRITETHSVSATKILYSDALAGASIMDSMFQNAVISQEQRSQIQAVLDNCLDEDQVSFEMNSHLLPHELTLRHGSSEHILQLEWDAIFDREGRIEKILLAFKDVTFLKNMELKSKESSKEVEMIVEILEISSRDFGIFMNSSQVFMAENLRLLKANRKPDFEVLKLLFINYHTIKGSGRSLGFKNLTPVIHDLEQTIAQIQNKELEWSWDHLWGKTLEIQTLLDHYQNLNQVKLGRDTHMAKSFSYEEIEQLHHLLRQVDKEGSISLKLRAKPFLETVEGIRFAPAEKILREVLSNAEMLARDLGKESPHIHIHGGDILLSLQGQDLIRNAFVHVIRNSMDHGIETAAERIKSGKPIQGDITVQLSLEGQQLVIRFKDDGRGLNLRAIRRIAIDRKLIKPQQKVSQTEVAELIFEAGFSTSAETNEISGRGVGMSAVKEYFEKNGGVAEVRLLKEEVVTELDFAPFEFIFTLGESIYFQKAS